MTPQEKALIGFYRALPPEERRMLEAFAEFLAARSAVAPAQEALTEPVPIPRPEEETVVRAIKRLRATYPMLDPRALLHETSVCLSQHVLQGRPAREVIDELEIVFARHYQKMKTEGEKGKNG